MDIEVTNVSIATVVGLFLASAVFGMGINSGMTAMQALVLPPPETAHSSQNPAAIRANDFKPVTAPGHLARQWKVAWDHGKKVGPSTTIITGGSWLYAAYQLPAGKTHARNLYVLGASFLIGVPVYTALFLRNTNSELCRRAAAAESGKKPDKVEEPPTDQLIAQWRQLHLIRIFFPVLGMACIVAANVK